MPLFQPIRDYFRRHRAKTLSNRASSVHLVNQWRETHPGNFVFPGTDFVDRIQVDGQRVGYVDYGINPLGDRLYINMLDIEPNHQQQGIGSAVLWQLWLMHQVPIVPLHQYATSDGFWSRVRARFAAAGALVEEQLRFYQLDDAKQRWQHLVPESKKDRSIREYREWVESEQAAGRPTAPGIR
jgi:hypothetical protein